MLKNLIIEYKITLQPEIGEFLPDWIATKEKRREWNGIQKQIRLMSYC